MKTNFTYGMLLAGLFVAACSNEEFATEAITEQTPTSEVVVNATMPLSPNTRLDFKEQQKTDDEGNPVTDDEGNPVMELSLNWTNTDKISVMQGSTGAPVEFSQNGEITTTDEGKSKTYFAGSMTINYASNKFHSVYPPTTSPNATSISLDMTGQTGALNAEKLYMYDSDKEIADNTLNFDFKHLTSILKLTLTPIRDGALTVGGTTAAPSTRATSFPTKLTSISIWGTGLKPTATVDITTASIEYKGDDDEITLENGSTGFTLVDGKVTAYLHFLPDSKIETLRINAVDDLGDIYVGTITKSNALTAGTMYEVSADIKLVQKGNYLLDSGKFIAPDTYDATTDNAIGVVAYLYDSSTPPNLKVSYGDGATTTPRGLVLALTNYSTDKWASDNSKIYYRDYTQTVSNVYSHYNGYQICTYLKNNTKCIAIQGAMKYSTVKAHDDDALGWYLPSIGEWMLILSSDGIGGESSVSVSSLPVSQTDTGTLEGIVTSLNDYLSAGGNTNYSEFSSTSTQQYWSANEYSATLANKAWFIEFSSTNQYVSFNEKEDTQKSHRVRAVLAF